MKTPPLSLYVHIPWCVQKCPYCDFNSHGQKAPIDYDAYIDALLDDLKQDIDRYQLSARELSSIFIGGGTPSLFPAEYIASLIQGINQHLNFTHNIEISMEANPGTFETERFIAYKQAGITRLSIGVQSFDDEKLKILGRIHSAQEAKIAIQTATKIFDQVNIDLMHGLPGQSTEQALSDLKQAIELAPNHLSWYQLTIEPNTLFGSKPPTLPNEDILWDIYQQGHKVLSTAGFEQYEISGYSKSGFQCQHNLNYWRFADYLGIGCGAHGKISSLSAEIVRTVKVQHPQGYLDPEKEYLSSSQTIARNEIAFEFFINRFRLIEACPKQDFIDYTGLSLDSIKTPIDEALQRGLIEDLTKAWRVTQKGKLFLNDLLELFL